MYQHNLLESDEDNPTTISAGAFYRWNDAVIPMVKLTHNGLSAGFTYDVNVSSLKTASYGRGGFELTLSYTGFFKNENSSSSKVRCPVNIH